MTRTQFEDAHEGRDEPKAGGLLTKWRACLLLLVMLLGLLTTPIALFYRWYNASRDNESTTSKNSGEGTDRIAFITPDGQVATIGPDGADLRRLTDERSQYVFPAWSPDGQQLAATGGGKVLIINLTRDSNARDASFYAFEDVNETPFYLYWSPDSQYVTFLADHPDGIALHLVRGQLSEPAHRVLAVDQPFYWCWSPAADEILIHGGGAGTSGRLQMIDLNGDTTADTVGTAGVFQAPGISPSGRFRAFAVLDADGRSRLAVQDSDGEAAEFEFHQGQLALTWSPVAELLAYRSPIVESPLNGGPLRLFNAQTGEDSLLSNQYILAFFWSPDGRSIAYFSLPRSENGDVQIAAAERKNSILFRSQRQQGELGLELWVVDVASGRESRLTQFTPTLLFVHQFLPFFDQYALSHRLWSPDSDAVVFPVEEAGRSQIAVVTLPSGKIRLIADGDMAFWSQQ
jgi:TolB protein